MDTDSILASDPVTINGDRAPLPYLIAARAALVRVERTLVYEPREMTAQDIREHLEELRELLDYIQVAVTQ